MSKPFIAVPIGDPAGIGPEIVAKALVDPIVEEGANCVIIGDKNVMENAIKITGVNLTIKTIGEPEDGDYRKGVMNLIDLHNIDMSRFEIGKVDGMCGKAAYEYIEKSIQLANAKKVAAVSTTPINKEALKAGGVNFIGHTEIFGALTNTPDPLTMFEVRGMRVFFLSRHVSLRKACDMVTKERIEDYVKRCFDALKSLELQKAPWQLQD
ncbi:Pyridoxal phosphate biosynthesis protein [Butyrivibrio fibrisolvens 16/4]|nr:Pyridoxal phosphate biosynthesis protein [Butyrivibrio fibrisolvens 16/4]